MLSSKLRIYRETGRSETEKTLIFESFKIVWYFSQSDAPIMKTSKVGYGNRLIEQFFIILKP